MGHGQVCERARATTEIRDNREVLLARNKSSDRDLEEGSPDHPGEAIDVADALPSAEAPLNGSSGVPARIDRRDARQSIATGILPAALRQKELAGSQQPVPTLPSAADAPVPPPANGTVVLDVEQGGIVVPSFVGKSVRSAIELAESSGLDLGVVGSGLAQEQSPAPGTHVASGARIMVRFGR